MISKITRRLTKLILIACLIASIAGGAWLPVHAQASIEGWSIPVNLSKSGQTLLSFVTTDSSGVVHAFWLDRQNGMRYSHSTAEGWSDPQKATFPIPSSDLTAGNLPVLLMPKLISGPANWVYFFWQTSDGLRYTLANTSNGRTLSAWSNGGLVTRSSASYDVAIDEDGIVHVAYVQPNDAGGLEAGVYYIHSGNQGANWTAPVLLYSSPYLRNLTMENDAPRVENSVDLAVTNISGKKTVYVAFDNQPRKRVYVTRSPDGGVTWESAVEIDAPPPGAGLASPGQIHVSARGEQSLVAWQVKQSDTVCFTYYRNSDDGGKTWDPGQRIYTPYPGCAGQFEFVSPFNQFSVLMTSTNGLTFLNAWDGKTWTGFQLQSSLSNFIDPETQDNVAFTVSGWALDRANQLVVIGNDRGSGGDAWVTMRSLAQVSTWFANEPGWKITPEMERLTGEISDLQVVSETSEKLHAFWVQKEIIETPADVLVATEPSRVVYYSSLENNRWTEPVQILRAPHLAALPGGSTQNDDVVNLKVASGPDGRLWALWKNSVGGEAYFSWARASAAGSVTEWARATTISTIPVTAADFSMVVDRGGWVNIVYTVPVNEGRGVYLVQSRDQGKTWNDAILAFDGQAAKWERVAAPSLAAAPDGSLWVLFSHQPVTNSELTSGLFAIHSADRGVTWSAAEIVTKERVLQSEMLVQSELILHRIWLEQKDKEDGQLYHQTSTDGGATWSRVVRASDAAGGPGPAAAVIDRAGELHLAQILEDQQQRLLLRYWLWNGTHWDAQEDYDLGAGRLDEMSSIGLGISPQGQLGAVISRPLIGADAYQLDSLLVGFSRPVTLPQVVDTPLPPLPTETSAPQAQVTSTPAPTPTIDLATLNQGNPSTGGGTVGGLMTALVASVLVIGGGVLVAILRVRKRTGR